MELSNNDKSIEQIILTNMIRYNDDLSPCLQY